MSQLRLLPTTFVAGSTRRKGWRAALRAEGQTVWRCDCGLPHRTQAAALACSIGTLSNRGSGYYAEGIDMDDWQRTPATEEERREIVARVQSLPVSIDEDLHQLVAQRALIMQAGTYDEIRHFQGGAEGIKLMWLANREVRNQFDFTFLTGEWRIGQALLEEKKAPGGEAYHQTPVPTTRVPETRVPTLAEKVGNRSYALRLETIAAQPIEAFYDKIRDVHAREQQATLTGVFKLLKAEESAMRRLDSMTAPVIYVPERRVGDSRVMFPDIEPGSIPLMITDPPYEDGAAPLWRWVGPWANEMLMPGGSFICYFGHANLNRMMRILEDAGLTYFWSCVMMHEQSQRLPGKFVIVGHKPILWFVKDFRRGRTLVPDVVFSTRRNKQQHAWGQGQGGVTQWIHQLTEPGELILDPFCGSGQWGDIACREGRRWIGCDIRPGGTTTVHADELTSNDEEG